MTRLLFFMILSFSLSFAQQSRSIEIGGVTLTLGMSKNKVLEEISLANLKAIPTGNFYCIYDKEFSISDPVPAKGLGTVTFKNQKLYTATRVWENSYDEETIRLLRALISLVTSSMKDDVVSAKIMKHEYDMPDGKTKGFAITLCGKTFNVTDLDFPSKYQHWVNIEEMLQ